MIHSAKFIAIIGINFWGRHHVREFFQLGVLNSIYDLNTELLLSYKNKYPGTNLASSYQEILNNPNILAIVIAVPAKYHYECTKKAILAGKKFILVEKPFTMSLAEAQELKLLAEQHGTKIMVDHLLHYAPAVAKMKEIIPTHIGDIYYISSFRQNMGRVRSHENALWSLGCHDISLIQSIMNQTPESIEVNGYDFLQKGIYDKVSLRLNYSNTAGHNIHAQIESNWLYPEKHHVFSVVGSKGMLTYKSDQLYYYPVEYNPSLNSFVKHNNLNNEESSESEMVGVKTPIPIVVNGKSPLQCVCEEFIKYCLTPDYTVITDVNEAIQVITLLDQIQKQMDSDSLKKEKENPIKMVVSDLHDREKSIMFCHKSSYIDEGAMVGQGTKIWHFSHLMKCIIGENCTIGQNCFIGDNVVIGNGCKIQNNVSIYDGITIEDDCFVGPSVVFTNDLNPRAKYPKNGKYVKTIVKQGATIGANATIVCGITLGENCFIGAGAVVTKDVLPNATMVGNPAKKIGEMNTKGEKIL